MKRFVKDIAWFVLPVVFLLLVGELYMRSIPNIYRYKDDWMQEHAGEVETLVLGNSHTFDGISPSQMTGRVFNLAMPNQMLEHDYFLLTRYADGYKRLKRVIALVDECNILLPELESLGFGDRSTYYRIYMGHDKHSRWSLYNFEISNLKTCYRKVARWWKTKREGGNLLGCDSLGFSPQGEQRRGGEGMDAQFMKGRWRKASVVNRNVSYLVKIVKFCQERGVELVLITMPYRDYYYNQLDNNTRLLVRNIGFKYSQRPGVRYIDFQAISHMTDSDYIDNSHLKTSAAMRFSHELDSLLQVK
ncbi:MAG: hypothetical protein J5523_09790 [Muribaculaceae bacterium]|nr:hypothetical protein [Muribaculaceae bacterium]